MVGVSVSYCQMVRTAGVINSTAEYEGHTSGWDIRHKVDRCRADAVTRAGLQQPCRSTDNYRVLLWKTPYGGTVCAYAYHLQCKTIRAARLQLSCLHHQIVRLKTRRRRQINHLKASVPTKNCDQPQGRDDQAEVIWLDGAEEL